MRTSCDSTCVAFSATPEFMDGLTR
jgi:hypothetical protein